MLDGMKKVEPATVATKKSYEAVAAAVGAEIGAMFGMPVLKTSGKGFAGLAGNAMVFKLGGDAHAKALEFAGAELFDPSGMGRAMKEWVVVPAAHSKQWHALAKEAVAYVEMGGKPKKKKA
jgi:hypothetical protein